MSSDNTGDNSSRHSSSSRIAGEHDEKRVKELNREIMTIFGVYKASFGHASAALLSVLSYLSDKKVKRYCQSILKRSLISF
jgi:hypothetical protein